MPTLAELREGAKTLADYGDSEFVSTAQWNKWLNDGGKELHDLVATCYADSFFAELNFSLTSTPAGARFVLPPNFKSVRGLDRNPDLANRFAVRRFNFAERGRNLPGVGFADRDICYRPMGGVLIVEPFERATAAYRLYYVPKYVPMGEAVSVTLFASTAPSTVILTAGPMTQAYRGGQLRIINSDLLDGDRTITSVLTADQFTVSPDVVTEGVLTEATGWVTLRGLTVGPSDVIEPWSTYIEHYAAMKCLTKAGSAMAADVAAQLGAIKADIELSASTRDEGEADRVAMIENDDIPWPYAR